MRRVPIEDSFDLHSFLPADVPGVVQEYLNEAQRLGWTEVRIIHGKGIGARRAQVRRLLAKDPRVLGYFDAPSERGGSGATIVVFARADSK